MLLELACNTLRSHPSCLSALHLPESGHPSGCGQLGEIMHVSKVCVEGKHNARREHQQETIELGQIHVWINCNLCQSPLLGPFHTGFTSSVSTRHPFASEALLLCERLAWHK